MMELISVYVVGIITGFLGAIVLFMHLGRKYLKSSPTSKTSSTPSLRERMAQVKKITSEQLDMQARISGPQKNSLDGKYKNSLIKEVKRLEEEKTEILKSIIKDGYDPEISTLDEAGVVTQLKLSEYLAMQGISIENKKDEDQKPVAAEKDSDAKPRQVGKFTVYSGGKGGNDEGSTH